MPSGGYRPAGCAGLWSGPACLPAVASVCIACLTLSPGLPRWISSVEGPALDIGLSVILDVNADDFSSGWQQSVIWNFKWEIPTRKPSQSGRSEPTAELAQTALSSRRAYIPAAMTPDLPGTHHVTQSIHDMRPYSKGLFIPHRGDACWLMIS